MSAYLSQRIRGASNIAVHEQTEVSAIFGNRQIEEIEITTEPAKSRLPCSAIFVFIGAEPSADWLPSDIARDAKGHLLTGADLIRSGYWVRSDREPCPLETSIPGVLAAGDIRSGSTKRVGFAVGDGALAVTCAHRLLSTGR